MFKSFQGRLDRPRTWLAAFFRKPIVQAGAKAAAQAYAGPAGVKAVEIVGPKAIEILDPK